jgi:hypothetical protein
LPCWKKRSSGASANPRSGVVRYRWRSTPSSKQTQK